MALSDNSAGSSLAAAAFGAAAADNSSVTITPTDSSTHTSTETKTSTETSNKTIDSNNPTTTTDTNTTTSTDNIQKTIDSNNTDNSVHTKTIDSNNTDNSVHTKTIDSNNISTETTNHTNTETKTIDSNNTSNETSNHTSTETSTDNSAKTIDSYNTKTSTESSVKDSYNVHDSNNDSSVHYTNSDYLDLSGIHDSATSIFHDALNGAGNHSVFDINQVSELTQNNSLGDPSISNLGEHFHQEAANYSTGNILSGALSGNGDQSTSSNHASADANSTISAFNQNITMGANIQSHSLNLSVVGGNGDIGSDHHGTV